MGNTINDLLYKVKHSPYGRCMNNLRLPLQTNGAFSVLSGVLLTAAPDTVAGWLGLEPTVLIRLFGVVLLGHGLLLFWSAARSNPRPLASMNLFAIAPYPFAMIALAATGLVDTGLGRVLVLADGAIIAAMALWQWRSLRDTDVSPAAVAA